MNNQEQLPSERERQQMAKLLKILEPDSAPQFHGFKNQLLALDDARTLFNYCGDIDGYHKSNVTSVFESILS